MKVVAQQQEIEPQYIVERYSCTEVIVKDGIRKDTITVEQALRINEAFPMPKQTERNAKIFKEMNRREENPEKD